MAKQKTVYFAASVVMSLPSGWGSVLPVSSGILLQKRKLQKRKGGAKSLKTSASPMNISEVTVENEERIPTGIHELDRVLGGGIVKGSLSLVGGDPNREIHVIVTGMQESCEQQT